MEEETEDDSRTGLRTRGAGRYDVLLLTVEDDGVMLVRVGVDDLDGGLPYEEDDEVLVFPL